MADTQNTDPRHTLQRILGLAVQILEDLPDNHQPKSDMADMRRIMAGEDTGRDGMIQHEAVAVVLAWMTKRALAKDFFWDESKGSTEAKMVGFQNQLREFTELFQLIERCSPEMLALAYNTACARISFDERTDQ